ncbi:DUF1203 domain-containing protein [Martelella alba]|uniref:DUF1203 domain-containing protein n=1 Tax=Martelella alba TaxID=2590451 RepID=A0ABY2SE82_9HYPH|nr:DUF1203 domain-containing protein [Martelella alba]TKI02525.1 DUF1203 domain-containing protein [Martelella alba]
MSYIITGLNGREFKHLYGLSDDELKGYGAIRIKVDNYPAYPDRITLEDIPVGENGILLNHTYLDGPSPYRGSHAIFIWEGKIEPAVLQDCLPEVMRKRIMSLRAFDENDMLINASVVSGEEVEEEIFRMFGIAQTEYILAHNAKQGCFSCKITRG